MSILEWLGFASAPQQSADDVGVVRKIVDQLDGMEPERARFVAAFAHILSRAANADMRISADETAAMERIVEERGGLSKEQALVVVQMAKTQSLLFGGTENFIVTRAMRDLATREEKLSLLDCMFAVSAAEDGISATESNLVRQVATELQLEHAEFIAVRARYKEQLSVLRDQTASDPDS
jgi:uncharacterized tellurite resistance protein B-like protein